MLRSSPNPLLIALLGSSIAACAGDQPSQGPNPESTPTTIARTKPTLGQLAREAGGFVTSFDADGVPQFIWAIDHRSAGDAKEPLAAAKAHLSRYAPALDLRADDLGTTELRFLRDMNRGGYLAKWRQRVGGVEVYPSEISVLLRENLDLVAISGRLRRATAPVSEFELSPSAALALALDAHLAIPIGPEAFVDVGGGEGQHRFRLGQAGPIQMSDSRVKQILYARGQSLVPAWFVEFYAAPSGSVSTDAYRYVIAAADGRVLERRNLTASEAFTFRVWANPADGRPFDGPTADVTPHPTGTPDGTVPALIPANLVSIDGFNRFGDPWLSPSATETRGNNVDAYSDHGGADGFTNGDLRATVTAPRTFDRTFDPTLDPIASEEQTMASVAELFYVNNWLHDWWYDSGFDEAAGNAQRDNYDRGGAGGDPLLAEAQDNVLGGARNNANMSTPADGLSPRMQMYSWTGAETITLTLTPGGDIPANTASFGARNFDVTGEIAEATPADGCTAITGAVAGRIALVDRGACNFSLKAANAQAAGAVALIIADNAPRPSPPGLGGTDPTVTIGTMSVLQSDGAAIRAALQAGPVTARMSRRVEADRDGSLDQTVVAHEWGHYLHHRLADCGTPQCAAMSEGWGDFTSIHMAIAEGDDLNGAFATGVWATLDEPEASFFGIRRVAYSADFAKNALTFRHISDDEPLPTTAPIFAGGPNSEVHNAGEVWSTMLTEAYVALHRASTSSTATVTRSFAEVQRLMGDYIVAGLQLTPRDATYTEARDAILAAAYARSPSDMITLAAAFARRGAGSCAVSPPRDSEDFIGVIEGFDLRPRSSLARIELDESIRSCDQDGILDADERGRVRLSIGNAGPVPLTGATVTLTSTSPGVSFPAGASVQLGTLAPLSSTELELELALDPSLADMSSLVLSVRLDSANACETTLTSTVITLVNYDEVGGATSDGVESRGTPWTATGAEAADVWARSAITPFDHAWLGNDVGTRSDTSLESPALQVSTSTAESFVISFDHRYRFETDPGGQNPTHYDGAVIELSRDDGLTWEDLATFVDPGYGGEITDSSGNPLGLRMGYVDTSSAWPNRHRVSFDFGNTFAGESVRIRFRIGTDAAVGAYGWEIDNLDFQGITNAPFESLANDLGACPPALVADAGPDKTYDPGRIVTLGGSGTSFEGLPFTYAWTQVAGPAVEMSDASTAEPIFVTPVVSAETVLTFELTIDDGIRTASDRVDITVRAAPDAVVIADAGEDATVAPSSAVVLDGSGSRTAGPLPLTYSWAQTGGPTVTLDDPAGAVARFTAPAPETNTPLTFELTVTDGLNTGVDSVEITVAGYELSADAGEDQTVGAGAVVVLDGSKSASSTNLPLTFSWAQTAGPEVTIESGDAAVARFTAPSVTEETVLTFELTVGDGSRTSVASVDVTVEASELTADAGADQVVNPRTTVVLDGSASSIGSNVTYAWAQKAGPSVTLSNPAGIAPSFTAGAPMEPAMLTFELTVSDGGATATDSVIVTIRAVEEDEGCDCSTTHEGEQSSALAILGLAGLAVVFRRRR